MYTLYHAMNERLFKKMKERWYLGERPHLAILVCLCNNF